MTVTQWTELNYQPFKEACQRICEGNPLFEELSHYVLSEFLGKTEVQSIVQSGGAFFYCLRMATNNWKSTTSPFYRNYRDPNLSIELKESHFQEKEERDEECLGKEHTHKGERTKSAMNGLEEISEWSFEEIYDQIQQGMGTLGWYERELLQVYAENGGNASLVSRLTKIPRTSINLTIRKVKLHLTKKIR